MDNKPHTIALHESLRDSIISDIFTFVITAGLILLADGRSFAWQVITIGMFLIWVFAKTLTKDKVLKFYSKRELVEWAQSLPENEKGNQK